MTILGIETSCDETAVGIVEKKGDRIFLKSNVVATSLQLHAKTGGIIPEIAAREQVKYMLPVLQEALDDYHGRKSLTKKSPVDAIAVTYGPGLVGSLLVGIETARTLAYLWNIPVIPVNHMLGHIYANWLETDTKKKDILFPCLILVVSGNHTDLLLMKQHGQITVIGATRDDAAGEAFDKIARLLGLPYPGGPQIQQLAAKGNPQLIHFPRPLLGDTSYDFSFSGLKTAVYRYVAKQEGEKNTSFVADIAAATQEAIVDVLVKKTMRAVKEYNVQSLVISGGVSANDLLRVRLHAALKKHPTVAFFAPEKKLCTDNGAMIAAAAAFNYHPLPWRDISVQPQLYY